jgi:UDP-GlcNAc:undecaprenyl-phosphate/decaprenyl-phosphate GlcNAc-1-phosphate transferase
MHHWHAAFGFLVAAGVATLITPVVGRLARALKMVDRPRVGGLTERVTPLLGGVGILIAIVAATALFMPHFITLPRSARTLDVHTTVNTWGLIVGAVLITLVGAIDDRLDLRWWLKLFGQVAAAVIAVKAGAIVTDVTIPFLGAHQFPHAGPVLTVFWLVAMMNVVNFTDGIDGLAAGLSAIDGIAFTIIAFNLGVTGAAILAAITAGAALGFLVHNFHPASIFMGDAGSNLLGYMLGVTAVVGSLKTNAVVALIVPLVILAIPLLDTSFVVAKRLKYKRPPWSRDANHFHHRFARIGFSQRKTVAYLYAWSTVLAGLAVAMRLLPYHPHNAHYNWLWVGVLIGIGMVALAASVYLVVVLEIVKLGRLRLVDLRRADPAAPEEEIQARAARDVETGEFTRVR